MKNKGDMIKNSFGVKNPKFHPFLHVKSANSAESVYHSIPIHWQVIFKGNLTKFFGGIFITKILDPAEKKLQK